MIDLLMSQPLFALVGVVVAALLVWAVVKRLLKMALFLLLCLAGLLFWLKLTGQEVPSGLDAVGRAAGRAAKGAVEVGVEAYRSGAKEADSLRQVN